MGREISRPNWGPPAETFEGPGGRLTPGNAPVPVKDEPDTFADDIRELDTQYRRDGPLGEILDNLPPETADRWRADPAGPAHRVKMLRQALAIDVPEGELKALVRSFENGVYEGVQDAVLEELGQGPPSRVPTLDSETLRLASETTEGELLRRHWLGRFDRNMSRVLYRVRRVRSRLSPSGNKQLNDWLNQLSPRQMTMALIALGE